MKRRNIFKIEVTKKMLITRFLILKMFSTVRFEVLNVKIFLQFLLVLLAENVNLPLPNESL